MASFARRAQIYLEIAFIIFGFVTRQLLSIGKYTLPRAPRWIFRAVLSQWRKLRDSIQEATTATILPNLQYEEFQSDDEIRVLTVLPGGSADILRCTLQTVALDDGLDFTAASYTWARLRTWPETPAALFLAPYFVFMLIINLIWQILWPAQPMSKSTTTINDLKVKWVARIVHALDVEETRHVIVCNGQVIRIGENLFELLRQLRHDQKPHTRYWIDAICINQQDVRERNHQILLMPKIYALARRVLAWLGPCPTILDDTRIISNAIGKSWVDFDQKGLGILLPSLLRWYLLYRPYFMRIWIVQEIILAEQIVFLIGSHRLSFDELEQMFTFTTREALPGMDFIFDKIAMVNGLFASRRRYRRREGWSLVDHLLSTTERDFTDPLDLVYAGLGPLHESKVEGTRPKVAAVITYPERYESSLLDRPDYEADLRETYVHCAIRLLQQEGLGALSCAYDGRSDQREGWFEMPSWVPHFSSSPTHSLLLADTNRTYAAGGSTQPRIKVTPSELLQLESGALLLDSVDQVFGSGMNAIDDLLVRLLDANDVQYPYTNEDVFVALARTLMADCFRGQRLGPRAATARLMNAIRDRLEIASRRVEADNFAGGIINSATPWRFASPSKLAWYWKDVVEKRTRLLDIVGEYLDRLEEVALEELYQAQLPEENHGSERSSQSTAPAEKLDEEDIKPSKAPQIQSVLGGGVPFSFSNSGFLERSTYLHPAPDPYNVELEQKLQHHAFFMTKAGRFGIGSPHLLQGDVIIVPVGSAVPYVGRRLNSIKPVPRFKLVGEAYVHGIMDGELLDSDLWRPEVINFR